MNPTKTLTVKFPTSLVSYTLAMRKKQEGNTYVTNTFIKPITTWLILKAESKYSVIKNYQDQIEDLAFLCGCSVQTFKKRLRWAVSERLATIEGSDIYLKSYKQLSVLYYVNLDHYKLVSYDPTTDKDLHLHMFAADIEDNKSRQAYMVKSKMDKNPALTRTIKTVMLRFGADERKLSNFNYMLNGMKKLYKHSFVAEPEIHSLLNQVRPDCNRGIEKMADDWEFKCKQSVSYYKRLMKRAGIIRIHKGEAITSQVRSRNSECHVIWNRSKFQTVLRLVDTIEVIDKTPKPGTNGFADKILIEFNGVEQTLRKAEKNDRSNEEK